jgi:hypothetical protein
MKISELPPEQQQIKREYNRLQKRKSREKEALKQLSKMGAAIEAERARRMNEEGSRDRLARNICFFGEVSPGVDAQTITDALQVCREFARALNQPDVQQPESLRDFELRIGRVWLEHGGPFLNRKTQQLSPGWGTGTYGKGYWLPFEEKYKPLPGAAQKIDIENLSPLPEIPQVATPPAPIEPAERTPGDEAMEHATLNRGRAQTIQQSYGLPADALRYLNGGQL